MLICTSPISNMKGTHEAPTHLFQPAPVSKSCCVRNCAGWESRKLFHFPQTEVARNNWARACNLQLPISKNVYICGRHFHKDDVSSNKILNEALPVLHIKTEDDGDSVSSQWSLLPVEKTYGQIENAPLNDISLQEFERYSRLHEIEMKCKNSEEITVSGHKHYARVAKGYQRNALKQSRTIQELKRKIFRLTKKCQALEKNVIITGDASVHAIIFAKMILSKKNSYTEEEKVMALNINYMSTKAYNFMREDLEFALNHKKTLLRWRPIRYASPGIDAKVLNNLQKIVQDMKSEERICQLVFDEVSIRKDLTYNKVRDLIDGFVDNGEGHRESVIGNKCCFFMLKGLVGKWKYVLSYYVAKDGVKSTQLMKLLKSNINASAKIGLNIKTIVCDQGTQNLKLRQLLGATLEQPYFFHNEKKIYFMFDYCHLIKCIRNAIVKHDIKTRDGITTFEVVRKIYAIDQANVNVYPGTFDKMSVSKATQLLSNSVAAAIGMAIKENMLGSDEHIIKCAKATQLLFKKMNDLFDELDCKTLYNPNPLRRPIQRNCIAKINRLKDHIDFIKAIIKPNNIISCFDSTVLTINAMIALSGDILNEHLNISFILLGKMNQDALENFFYKIRANLGCNNHPSAHKMQYIVARLLSMHILRRKFSQTGSNCEEDDDINLEWNIGQEDDLGDNLKPAEQLAVEQIDIPDEHFANTEKTAEIQVHRYYTGYAIYQKVLCRLKCQKCVSVMKKSDNSLEDSSEALIRFKNYKSPDDLRLVNPEDRIFQISRLQMSYYKELFLKNSCRVGIKTFIITQITAKTEEEYPEWYNEAGDCLGHRHQFLDFLITVLLYKNSKWLAQQTEELHHKVIKERYFKNKEKLKKLVT
ncbi:DNA transposase THAP9 isoform X1 [Bactrocera oleae]|uniref:DNA transposase THAP9 isoform X1 n=2 Tax=Bactrocera oleae TaxID=104688 RepID=UPI00387E23C6